MKGHSTANFCYYMLLTFSVIERHFIGQAKKSLYD